MRKLLILFTLFALSSCIKDPWSDINAGGWNHEHSLLNITVEGQVGKTVIKNDSDTTGTITLTLVPQLINDMSSVHIKTLELSFEANSNVQIDESLDFSNGNKPTIEVSSISGEARVYTFEASEFVEELVGNYKITGSMVLGGTGHEYGGAGLMAPEDKSWVWADRGGYGPTAEYDNYLKFEFGGFTDDGNTFGTVTNYAGEDGKFWNCMFLAKYNKEGNTDIDLHNYYRNIPIGVSSWERDYTNNTISFTDNDGKVTVSRLFDSGAYTLLKANGDGKEKILNVDNQAFGFEVNGQDDWTNIYSDYDKFVKKARAHFVFVQKVDEIPAASLTEGSEGDIAIEEPEPPAPLESLEGSYSLGTHVVFSYNVSMGTLTLMSPQEKEWDFNNVAKEKDNKLILTTISNANGIEKGEADYTPGDDEQYWDYTFKAGKCNYTDDAVDASALYGFLPHGKSEYCYNSTEKTITFTQGEYSVTVDFIVAGSYSYTNENIPGKEKPLIVNSFALSFATPSEYLDLFSQLPAEYSDSHWLLYWVKNYIMCFDKDTEPVAE